MNPNFEGDFTIDNFSFRNLLAMRNNIIEKFFVIDKFLNFSITAKYWKNILWPFNWKGFPILKGKIAIETSSFNPTGEPHLGNMHLAIHGTVFERILRLLGGDVTNIYYINDLGKNKSTLSKIDKNLKIILKKLKKFKCSLPKIFFKESYFVNNSKKIIEFLKTEIDSKGATFYKGIFDQYYLTKDRNNTPTYLLNDLSFNRFLLDHGYDHKFQTLGNDHKGHMIKFNEIFKYWNLKPIWFAAVGKISVQNSNNEIIKFSKRKGHIHSDTIWIKQWRRLSLSMETHKDKIFKLNSITENRKLWHKIHISSLRSKILLKKSYLNINFTKDYNSDIDKWLILLKDQLLEVFFKRNISLIFKNLIKLSNYFDRIFTLKNKINYENLLNYRRSFILLLKLLK